MLKIFISVFILSAVFFSVALVLMALGQILNRKCLRGSCGGQAVTGSGGEDISCETCPNRQQNNDP